MNVTRSDTDVTVRLACGPGISGEFQASLNAQYTFKGFDGSTHLDTLQTLIHATIAPDSIVPPALRFIAASRVRDTQQFAFHLPTYCISDSVRCATTAYPFKIASNLRVSDSEVVRVAIHATGGDYNGTADISYPIHYYDSSVTQRFTVPLRAEIDNASDSVFWYQTPLLDTINALTVDSNHNIYAVSSSVRISSDGGTSWMSRGLNLGVARELLIDGSLMYLNIPGRNLAISRDTGATWSALPLIPCCIPNAYRQSVDHLFLGRPRDTLLYAFSNLMSPSCCSLASQLQVSADSGSSWSLVGGAPDSGVTWLRQTSGSFLWVPGFYRTKVNDVLDLGEFAFVAAANGISVFDKGSRVLSMSLPEANDGRAVAKLRDSSILALVYGRGVYASDDFGKTWYGLNGGLHAKDVTSLAFDGERFWLGTKSSGVYKSEIVAVRTSSVQQSPPAFVATLYPNPSTRVVRIPVGDAPDIGIQLFDVAARPVVGCGVEREGNELVVNVSCLPAGVYEARLVMRNETRVCRFVVAR
ncbi:MAG: hypothetical protein JSS75_03120 [Bacteroidetes bacterium]|nr:hypothetical protein [Bacteroidota bacterium]